MPCPASTKLMRESQSGQTSVALTSTSRQLVPFDPDRVALVISCGTSGEVWLGLRKDAAQGAGLLLPQDGQPLQLTLGDHGALVMGPITAVAPTADETITFWDASVGPIRG